MKKNCFYTKTSVAYPFVNFKKNKNLNSFTNSILWHYFLSRTFWYDITVIVQVRDIGFL